MGGVVPLSEHEQRQLEQIEQALYREDPKFGRLVRSSDPRVHYKRKLVQACIGVLIGAGLVAAGIVTPRVYFEADWKRPQRSEVARFLKAGGNEISVTVSNSLSPPALWLSLEWDTQALLSD